MITISEETATDMLLGADDKNLDELTQKIYYAATGRKELVEVLTPIFVHVAKEVLELWQGAVEALSAGTMKLVITDNVLVIHPKTGSEVVT